MSNSLWPRGLQQARLPCPSPSPGVCSNSCLLNWWCHPIISSSVVPFSCLQSFTASGSFPMSQLFTSGGQSIGASVSATVLPVNILVWSPCSSRDSQGSFPTPQFKSINSLELLTRKTWVWASFWGWWRTGKPGEGQGSLACNSPWGCKESDLTERLNNNREKKKVLWDLFVRFGAGVVCLVPVYKIWLLNFQDSAIQVLNIAIIKKIIV